MYLSMRIDIQFLNFSVSSFGNIDPKEKELDTCTTNYN